MQLESDLRPPKSRAHATGIIGIVPAAGRARRLAPFTFPKELLPVIYERGSCPGEIRPRLAIDCALAALASGGIQRSLVVVAPWKYEIISQVASGHALGLDVAYLLQEEARGMPYAIDLAYPWVAGHGVALVMPDTILEPADCFARLRSLHASATSDVTLGVFPTERPQHLGPVVLDGTRVQAVYDKCPHPPVSNTWGCAIWGPRFTELLHRELAATPISTREPVLGEYFAMAMHQGLRVCGLLFHEGRHYDLGVAEGIGNWLARDVHLQLPSAVPPHTRFHCGPKHRVERRLSR